MKRLFTPAALGAALALSLAPASGAFAAQYITITSAMSPVLYPLCGNATDTTASSATYGDCATTNSSDGAANAAGTVVTTPGNTVTIEDGATAEGNIYGRLDESATAATSGTGNIVLISGDTAWDNLVYGAGAFSGTDGFNATATLNKVTVSGANATAPAVTGGDAEARSGTAAAPITASASKNQVVLAGGSSSAGTGGNAFCWDDCTAEASSNTVSVTGGVVYGLVGGNVYAPGSGAAKASGNTVSVTGDTVNGDINGASVSSDSGAATASNNTVSITGGTVKGNIVGAVAFSYSGDVTAANNTVEIGGSASIDPAIGLYGGMMGTFSGAQNATGNTLKLSIGEVTVTDVNYFQAMNFTVPAAVQAAGKPMLSVSSKADIDGVTISVTVAGSLKVGDEVLLIDASGAFIGLSGTVADVTSPQGYKFEIVGDPQASGQLIVQVKSLPPVSAANAAAVPTLTKSALALLALLLAGGAMAMRRKA